jgi:hypothetical protein
VKPELVAYPKVAHAEREIGAQECITPLRLLEKSLEVAWERAFVALPTFEE